MRRDMRFIDIALVVVVMAVVAGGGSGSGAWWWWVVVTKVCAECTLVFAGA